MRNPRSAAILAARSPALLLPFITLLFAPAIFAQVVASTSRGVIVAHDHVIELSGRWTAEGVANPRAIIAGTTRAAILDPLANEVRVVDLDTGRGRTTKTAETPAGGVFVDNDLFVITRDGGTVEHIGAGTIRIGADPAFIRAANHHLYVYQRLNGVVSEISIEPFALVRQVKVAPFASDFEIDNRNGYLVVPRSAKIATFSLVTMTATGTIDAGAVPVDITMGSGESALTARQIAIADPSGKRVWMIEGQQSMTQAISRGFLRGLLGLGLYSNPSSQFPTGVDRVFTAGGRWIAYDSSTGTLYRFSKSKSSVIATGVAPGAFAMDGTDLVYAANAAVRRLHL